MVGFLSFGKAKAKYGLQLGASPIGFQKSAVIYVIPRVRRKKGDLLRMKHSEERWKIGVSAKFYHGLP
jgi:hypothetical protein